MKRDNLAVIRADGIGPKVVGPTRKVLEALAQAHGGVEFDFQDFDWGSERYLKSGAMMPEDGIQQLERGGFDAILLGPVGSDKVPDHITLWGLLLPIRQGLDQYVNLRPIRLEGKKRSEPETLAGPTPPRK